MNRGRVSHQVRTVVRGLALAVNARGLANAIWLVVRELFGNRLGLPLDGISMELHYWEKQASGLGDSSERFKLRANPESLRDYPSAIDPYIWEQWETIGYTPTVLDVGSGPISTLTCAHRQKKIRLTATDILAEEYKLLLRDYGYTAAMEGVEFTQSEAETLSSLFGENHFDMVHCSNALDHTQSPSRSFEEMCRVAKVGGFVVICGNVREGTHEGWDGIHMHDLYIEGDDIYREDKHGERSNLSGGLPIRTVFSEVTTSGSVEFMSIIFRKEGNC